MKSNKDPPVITSVLAKDKNYQKNKVERFSIDCRKTKSNYKRKRERTDGTTNHQPRTDGTHKVTTMP